MASRLYLQESSPFFAALFDQWHPDGTVLETGATGIAYVTTQVAYIPMFRADGAHALLELDASTTLALSLATTGVGGLNEAVGGNRAYAGHVIARNDGAAGLYGVRMGTGITGVLPVGYEWYSRAFYPVWTDATPELHYWVYVGQGSFTIDAPGAVLSDGVANGGQVAIPLGTLGGGEEFAISAIRQILCRFSAINAQAANRDLVVQENDPASSRQLWSQTLGQTAPATESIEIEKWVNTLGIPDTCLSYSWDAAPTTGFSVIPRMVQF